MRLQYKVLLIIGLITAVLTVVIYYSVASVVQSSASGLEHQQAAHHATQVEAMLRQPLAYASKDPKYLAICDKCLIIEDRDHWVSDENLAAILNAFSAGGDLPAAQETEGWTALGKQVYWYRWRASGSPALVLMPLPRTLIEEVSTASGLSVELAIVPEGRVRSGVFVTDEQYVESVHRLDVAEPALASARSRDAILLSVFTPRLFTDHARRLTFYLMGLLYVLAVVIAAISVIMVRYMVIRRVTRLREKAQKIAADGNIEGLFQVSGNDEIRELANDFNRMILTIAHAQEQLKLAQQEAEHASAAKSQFLANMSHEIRTPLTVVLGYADLVADEQLGARERRHYIDIIRRHGEQLVGVINDVLDLAKIEAGRMSINQEPVEIRNLVNEIVDMMQLSADRKHIGLQANIDALVPALVQSDALRLKQILINLVSNAIKFTFEGRVNVNVRVGDSHLDDPKIIIEVCDTGIGMDDDTLANLFDAFHQADNSSTRKFGGTGLGLTIARQLAELLGGSLVVESKLHEGSRFQVVVPLLLPATDNGLAPQVFSHRRGEVHVIAGTRALIVDDNAVIRLLVRKLLARVGFEIEECTDGAEACQRLLEDSAQVDLIIMDMHMPEMDGIQATRCLRAAQIKTPIIALSANVLDADRKRLMDAGCSEFLSKPIEMERFYEVLFNVIGDKLRITQLDELSA